MYDEFRAEVEAELALHRHERGEKPASESILARLLGFTLLVLGAGLYELLKIAADWCWRLLVGGVTRYGAALGVGVVVLVAGYLFFEFRRAKPTYYGLVEIGFGVMTGVRSLVVSEDRVGLASQAVSTQTLLGVVGGIYLVVRGLDNFWKRKRERDDRIARTKEVLRLVTERVVVQPKAEA